MIVKEFMETLAFVDKQYNTFEDKNYFLVHKIMELLPHLENFDISKLKAEILQKYNYKDYFSLCEYVCVMSKENAYTATNIQQKYNIEHVEVESILDFYKEYDKNLILYIKGHLFLEFAMNKIIEKALKINAVDKTFSKKIDLLSQNYLILEKEKDLLKAINKIRNEIAHNINYNLTFDTIFNLVEMSSKADIIYSEETIYKNKKLSQEWYGINGVIEELVVNTFCHLIDQNESYFEETEIFQLIL